MDSESLEFASVSAIWFHIKLSASPIALEDRNVTILEVVILVSNHSPTQTFVCFRNLAYLKCNILNVELIDHEK